MVTQEVEDKLKALQNELDKLSTAINHINKVSEAARAAFVVLENYPVLLQEIKDIDKKHHDSLLKEHKDRISSIEKQLNKVFSDLKDKSKLLTDLIEETRNLNDSISKYFDEIKRINFPERLDKIDNQITSLNIGVGNMLTAIQNCQTTLQKTINDFLLEFKAVKFSDKFGIIDNQFSTVFGEVEKLLSEIKNTQLSISNHHSFLTNFAKEIENHFVELNKKMVAESAIIQRSIRINRILTISFGTILLIGISIIIFLTLK